MTNLKKFIFFFIFFAINSCSFFEEEDTILPGKRENVFEIEEEIIVKANKKIILSDPMEIKSWEQQHQNIRNHLFHFLSNPSLKLLSKVKLGSINFENLEHIVSPVIKNNTIFYVDDSFNVFSKNLENGKNYWRTQLKQEKKEKLSFIGGLAATDNELIVTTALGNIYSIDLNNGDIKWVKNFLVQFSRPPTIYKNKIFAVSDDNQIFALSLNLGEKIWSHIGNIEEVSIIGGSKPIIENNLVVVTYSSGEIFALNENDGSLVWFDNVNTGSFFNRNIVNDIQAPLTSEGGRIYVPTFSDKFIAYNLEDGKKIWNLKFSSINPIVISGETIYVLDSTGRLLCLDKKRGKLLWAVQLRLSKAGKEINWYGPILTSYKIIVVSSEGLVLSLSPFTGKILSKIKFDENFIINPIQIKNKVLLISKQGSLFILG